MGAGEQGKGKQGSRGAGEQGGEAGEQGGSRGAGGEAGEQGGKQGGKQGRGAGSRSRRCRARSIEQHGCHDTKLKVFRMFHGAN